MHVEPWACPSKWKKFKRICCSRKCRFEFFYYRSWKTQQSDNTDWWRNVVHFAWLMCTVMQDPQDGHSLVFSSLLKELLRHGVQSVRRVQSLNVLEPITLQWPALHTNRAKVGGRNFKLKLLVHMCTPIEEIFRLQWGSNERSVRELSKGEQFYQLYSYSNYDPAYFIGKSCSGLR